MASSTEFKKALREGKLSEAFIIAMGNAPELHITTWISSPEDNAAQTSRGKCLKTHVNLIEGKIANVIGEDLMEDNLYGAIQKFHSQQVTQGHQAISQNLWSLQQMFRLMTIMQKQQNGEEFQPLPLLESFPKITPSPIAIEPATIIAPNVEQTNQEIETNLQSFPQGISQQNLSESEVDNVTDDLLSLVDLDIEEEEEPQLAEEENEDWGEWLDDDSSIEEDVVSLESVDINESKDWGKETTFTPQRLDNNSDNSIQDN
ncbi:MAG: hypothetical protein QNJ55_07260 [Xenococcus sp. MO_188.B8]|nr:hypothetical protein [Xenococcus sp. MO_188.B8]